MTSTENKDYIVGDITSNGFVVQRKADHERITDLEHELKQVNEIQSKYEQQMESMRQEIEKLKLITNQMKPCQKCGKYICLPIKCEYGIGWGYTKIGYKGSICGQIYPDNPNHPKEYGHE
jgi:predicted nucleic acid binding AN1-type Zn finger protein